MIPRKLRYTRHNMSRLTSNVRFAVFVDSSADKKRMIVVLFVSVLVPYPCPGLPVHYLADS
ncbi:MAG TPA: hypothetical protein VLJ68_06590 [Chitinophagaceae bacterium]|nr:hypothetical protein [Chitinophagaceae bacterium]